MTRFKMLSQFITAIEQRQYETKAFKCIRTNNDTTAELLNFHVIVEYATHIAVFQLENKVATLTLTAGCDACDKSVYNIKITDVFNRQHAQLLLDTEMIAAQVPAVIFVLQQYPLADYDDGALYDETVTQPTQEWNRQNVEVFDQKTIIAQLIAAMKTRQMDVFDDIDGEFLLGFNRTIKPGHAIDESGVDASDYTCMFQISDIFETERTVFKIFLRESNYYINDLPDITISGYVETLYPVAALPDYQALELTGFRVLLFDTATNGRIEKETPIAGFAAIVGDRSSPFSYRYNIIASHMAEVE